MATYAKLEDRGGCNTVGDATAVEASVDAFVGDIGQLAPVLESGCAPVQAATLHGAPELFLGNARLALIEDGKVPCLHTERITKAKCAFLGDASGAWLESSAGSYALAGQPISRKGEPDGEYVIASQLNADLSVPCIEPAGGDTGGTSTGTELAASCAIEAFLSERNATGYPLENFATREVCTSSYPHPELIGEGGPTLVRCSDTEIEPFYCCWTGEGAGLNDPNGHERNAGGSYFTGASHYCHAAASGGVTVYAAKRPKTASAPPPIRIVKDSPLAWRPVSPLADIAN
jgi:hypothetical protein